MTIKNQDEYSLKRLYRLLPQLQDDEFRKYYFEANLNMSVSVQIKNMRGDMSKKDFAKKLGITQNKLTRLENPDTSKLINELLKIAHENNVALLVKFVDYETYIAETQPQSMI